MAHSGTLGFLAFIPMIQAHEAFLTQAIQQDKTGT